VAWRGGLFPGLAWAIVRSIVGVIRLANGEAIAQPYTYAL